MADGLPLLTLIIFSPLVGVLGACLFKDANDGQSAKIAAIVSSFVTLALSCQLWLRFDLNNPGFQFLERMDWIVRFGIEYHLGIDGISLLLVLVLSVIMPIALIGSWNIKNRSWQFQTQMLLLQMGMSGCFIALDVFLFYVFFEVMLVPLYFMIGIWGGVRRQYATVKFFIYTMVGSLFMLVAIVYTAILYQQVSGQWSFNLLHWYTLEMDTTTQLILFSCFALAFAVKSPLVPFHTWLPTTYYESPDMGYLQLAAVMLKVGSYGFLRFAFPIFPEAAFAAVPIGVCLSLIGIIYGGLVAMVQDRLKTLIAYTSVAHMGFILLGLFVFNEQGLAGAVIQMVNHSVVTCALFLCVGMLHERSKTQEIVDYGGVIAQMPIFAIFFLLFSLASIGLPGLNGFVGEALILLGAAKYNIWLAIIAASGVVIAAVYMLWMYQRVMFGPVTNAMVRGLKDLNLREIAILAPLAFVTIWMGVYPQPFFDRMNGSVTAYLKQIKADEFYQKQVLPQQNKGPTALAAKTLP